MHSLAVRNTHNNIFFCDSRMQIIYGHLCAFQRTERQLPTQTNAWHEKGQKYDTQYSTAEKAIKKNH